MQPDFRRHIEDLSRSKQYVEAHNELVDKRNREELEKQRRLRRLVDEQAKEYIAFQHSKNRYLSEAHQNCLARRESAQEKLWQRQVEDRLANDEALEVFAARQEERLQRRPIPPNPTALELRREEQRLRQSHQFLEADAVNTKASKLEVKTLEQTHNSKHEELTKKIKERDQQHRALEELALTNLKGKMEVEEMRMRQDVALGKARFHHLERDMLRLHAKQREELELLGYLKRPTATESIKMHRGTALVRRVEGDPNDTPPLCALYGHLLETM